jgi:hypothetical protein
MTRKKFYYCNKYVKPKYLKVFVEKISNEEFNKQRAYEVLNDKLENAIKDWYANNTYRTVYKTIDNWINYIFKNFYISIFYNPGAEKPEKLKHVLMTNKVIKIYNNYMKQKIDTYIGTGYDNIELFVKRLQISERLKQINKDFV